VNEQGASFCPSTFGGYMSGDAYSQYWSQLGLMGEPLKVLAWASVERRSWMTHRINSSYFKL
jgi:hypothetical protein